MINNALARRYAKALVQLGSEGGLVDKFREELAAVDRVFANNAEIRAAFSDPALTEVQKKSLPRRHCQPSRKQ